ncbi:MAG: hypothetical protein A2219_05615 [Elusimicrobia bacterium RIFOXYA2_FULL_50_26]|nr:MAG: hypothetical protein A2219_05615 [Elusimicrobia bacterium RIFOXYA2_FULL_50_26]OGS24535.1 MAG: hypothetical protein A2314_04400 [Elusimicrobia bacterium RIFOXYB2_FULL_50_12]
MKRIIRDKNTIDRFKQRLNEWIVTQSKGQHQGFSDDFIVTELAEYPCYRLSFTVDTETRKVISFQRPDAAIIKAPPTITDPQAINPWDVKKKTTGGSINYRTVIEIPESLKSTRCISCQGKGTVHCSNCLGQTTTYCPQCRGDGKITCPVCRGAKLSVCPECSGGYRICPTCEGKKRLPCVKCGQSGVEQCEKCSGKGQILSGLAVEIIYKPLDAKQEISNNDIPAKFNNQLLTFSKEWLTELSGDDEKATPESLAATHVPKEIIEIYRKMRQDMILPENYRIIGKRLLIEKKPFFCLSYSVRNNTNSIWLAHDAPSQYLYEHNPLLDLYEDVIHTCHQLISRHDIPSAITLLKSVEQVEAISEQISGVRRAIRRSMLVTYAQGAAISFILTSSFVLPLLYQYNAHSFNRTKLLAAALLLNLAGSLTATLALQISKQRLVVKRLHRIAAGFICGLLITGSVYAGFAIKRINPARTWDENAMRADYARHFPFGLRTLPNQQDIEFLEKLAATYAPTGINVEQLRKDAAWLKARKEESEKRIIQMEEIRKNIEEVNKGNIKKKTKPRRRRY